MTREETRDEIKRYLETLYNLKNDLFVVQHKLQTFDTADRIFHGPIYSLLDYANECFNKTITSLKSQLHISRSSWKYFWWYKIVVAKTIFRFNLIDIWAFNSIYVTNILIYDILQDCENDPFLKNQVIDDVYRLQHDLSKFVGNTHLIGRKWV